MNKGSHIAFVLLGAVMFFAYCGVVMPHNNPVFQWYQYPAVHPVVAGAALGRHLHDVNIPVLFAVWALECFIAGLLLDVTAGCLWRRFRAKQSGNG